jgi:hypothetical protein
LLAFGTAFSACRIFILQLITLDIALNCRRGIVNVQMFATKAVGPSEGGIAPFRTLKSGLQAHPAVEKLAGFTATA